MSDIMSIYNTSLQVFLGGAPEDVISLVAIGIALVSELFFFSIPFLLVKR